MMRAPRLLIPLAGVLLLACGDQEPRLVIHWYNCEMCHLQDHKAATDPVHTGKYPARCVACHNNSAWKPEDNSNHDVLFPRTRGAPAGHQCHA